VVADNLWIKEGEMARVSLEKAGSSPVWSSERLHPPCASPGLQPSGGFCEGGRGGAMAPPRRGSTGGVEGGLSGGVTSGGGGLSGYVGRGGTPPGRVVSGSGCVMGGGSPAVRGGWPQPVQPPNHKATDAAPAAAARRSHRRAI